MDFRGRQKELKFSDQTVHGERFFEEHICSGLSRQFQRTIVSKVGIGRHGDDRERGVVFPHCFDELDPRDLWHHQVRQQQVDVKCSRALQSLSTVASNRDRESGSFQETMDDAAQADVVIDEEDQSFGWFRGGHPLVLMWDCYRSLHRNA